MTLIKNVAGGVTPRCILSERLRGRQIIITNRQTVFRENVPA